VLLHKKWTFSLPFLTLIIGIITMASARIVFYTLIIVWLVSFFFVQRKLILNYTYTAFLFIFVLTNCFLFRPLSYLQFNEISFPIWALFIDLPPKKCDNSGTTRKQLTIDGLNALKSNYGMGVGGGNAVCIQEKKAATKLPVIKELHNFWLELAVEGGLLYALLFAFFYVWWLYKLWHSAQLQNELFQYWGTSFFLGAVGLLFGGIAPSSCIYFLPMYLFVGLSLVFLKLCLYEDSIIG
jgi:hypothetical protein